MANKEDTADLPETYKMDNKRRGNVLIFNQENFHNLSRRFGTATDKTNLTASFEALGFEVTCYDDSDKKTMKSNLEKASKENYSDADCIVCIFLSHGEEGHIFAKDNKISIKEIIDFFRGNNCRSLVGKPKIFIFQACRGDIGEDAVTPMVGDDDMAAEVMEDAAVVFTLPAGADFLMCYCASEGFTAFRHIEEGTYYIQELCKVLQKQGSTLEFTELLTLVNLKVSRHSLGNKKQMPCFSSTLTKKLYFRPKEQ
ncbi:caspase-6-like [Hoplias malabaricus]|uniref:caspase-6-like n=1 Tax=Hoplias malabaricus TaxID=27720 RepID=UPI00346237BD